MTGDVEPDQVTAEPVGEQLRQGRERLGLSVSAIADEQHLRPSVIQAIESGDYSKIDSELFLKGYVRAYARQVGLDADAIIADLNRELEPARQQKELEHQSSPLVSIERKKRRKRQVAKLLVVLLVVALVVYLIAGYLAQQEGSREPSPAPESPAETVAPDEESVVTEVDDVPPVAGPDDELSGPEQPLSDDALADMTGEPVPDPLEPELTGADLDELPADRVPAVTQSTEPIRQETQLRAPAATTEGRLQISFSGDCWVQVTDAEGRRLVSALRRSGERLDVTGEAPLTVVIGAMSAVESIQFQGESLNIGDFRVVNNRSEFTLEL
ncbi:cytoskeleton protein RodZ [Marinobacter sp. MBR-99]|jgi:cytoskeleton protein RodZ|uniref:RodZ domain-containing protein n=1 Tax=Marinobacter sp. MBR-99 TaxID=3156461 RepID=UPI00339350F5